MYREVGRYRKGRALRYKSSLVPRCGLSSAIPNADARHSELVSESQNINNETLKQVQGNKNQFKFRFSTKKHSFIVLQDLILTL